MRTPKLFSPATVLILALAALVLPVAAIEWHVLRHTNGTFMYPLDDTFIHMAMARNLAFHGVWGMNPYAFASASSSVLYTLLLAALFKVLSVHVLIPFVINAIVAIGVLVIVRRWLEKEGVPGVGQLVILLGLIFLTPLPILVICGMEHTLQSLFCFLFIYGFSTWLEKATKTGAWKMPWPLFVYGMLVTFIRYEGLFVIGVACLILWYHRKLGLAIRLGIVAVLPLVVFGAYSVAKGSYFLPNSVLLKSEGAPLNISGMLHYVNSLLVDKLTVVKTDSLPVGSPRPGISLLATQRLLIILPLSFLLFWKYIRQRIAYGYILGILLAVTLIHLCFAATGWLYRYEAYLIFCSTVIVGLLVWQYGREVWKERGAVVRWMMAVVVFAAVFPLVLRSAAAFTRTGDACVNIYQQQYQMGRFLHMYYDTDVNAVNDIGAVSFLTRGANVDLWGLGNIQVARSRKSGRWNPGFLDSLCRAQGAGTAVLYEKWFNDSMRSRWTKVATWQIPNNVICGDDSVSFFAIRPADAPVLKGNLQAFEKQLPAGVEVKYY
ncbi:MAG TPA: hypothetical protein VGS79_10475 [Puia sp.]|nr:hypothetical protein [Puia sp.]